MPDLTPGTSGFLEYAMLTHILFLISVMSRRNLDSIQCCQESAVKTGRREILSRFGSATLYANSEGRSDCFKRIA